jgi:hypothetical protein
VVDVDRIELRANEGARHKKLGRQTIDGTTLGDASGQFALSIVDNHSAEICSIPSLTEGEARWIADVLHRERPMWFR